MHSGRLDCHANRDGRRCDVANCLRGIGHAADQDSAIRPRNICVKVRTIRRVSSLGLEVLLWWGHHDGEALISVGVSSGGGDG